MPFPSALSEAQRLRQENLVLRSSIKAMEGLIHKQKQTEAALIFERQQLETIFHQSPAAMVLWSGPNFIFEKVNPLYQAIFPDRQLQGLPFLEACPEFKDQPFIDLLRRVLETGEPFVGKEVLARHATTKNGPIKDHYYDFTYMRINDAHGNPYGVYDHAIDVTARVLDRKKIESARQEADRANKAKSTFLANMSHEIRTPMNSVLGYTDLLRVPNLSKQQREDALSRIEKSGATLLRIIDDVLDISKIEAGKLRTEKTEFSPREVVEEVIALLRLQAKQKGLSLFSQFSAELPKVAHSDPARLRQILTNLVGNAIKFTAQGSVCIEVHRDDQHLFFDVVDTGIGIAKPDQRKLFHPFTQADESITRHFGGTGLGLALSQKLSRELNGDLILKESTPGVGSRFSLTIQAVPFIFDVAQKTAVATQEKKENLRLDSTCVLVVDDIQDNQVLMRHFLESYGAKVEIAKDGEQAIKKALSKDYDLILMDIQMPLLDGIQATKSLRDKGYIRPILALTAHALREEIDRSLEAGCNEHLTKPITRSALVHAIKKYVT